MRSRWLVLFVFFVSIAANAATKSKTSPSPTPLAVVSSPLPTLPITQKSNSKKSAKDDSNLRRHRR